MEVGELAALVVEIAGRATCPFDHTEKPLTKRTNDFPPAGGDNNATTLGQKMGKAHFDDLVEGEMPDGTKIAVQHTPHHLIPGDESWPETKLRKWVDKKFNHIKENIGYDVNEAYNGCTLPGVAGSKKKMDGSSNGVSSWEAHPNQMGYAHGAMKSTNYNRQFHDRHVTYSDFVINMLDKISEALDSKVENGESPGCGKTDCAGDITKKKKFDPPINLMNRLEAVAGRLEGKLVGNYRTWKIPLITSAWVLTLKAAIDLEEAKKKIADAGEIIRGAR